MCQLWATLVQVVYLCTNKPLSLLYLIAPTNYQSGFNTIRSHWSQCQCVIDPDGLTNGWDQLPEDG